MPLKQLGGTDPIKLWTSNKNTIKVFNQHSVGSSSTRSLSALAEVCTEEQPGYVGS